MTVRIYVGNLPEDVEKQELDTLFREAQEIQSLKLITNRKTNKCRGFGFITVKTEEEADSLVSRFNGQTFREQALKVEKALPRTKDTPETEEAPPASEPVAKPVKATAPVERPTPRRDAPNRNSQRQQNRRKSPAQTTATPVATGNHEATEPDPRWADALRQLKERLAMQTTGS
ncbi:RNA-binding region RNP-1 [Gloeomargarita lithophora Alchichica-D10]|uniref:RNA-binding region RNP-1 n=1 Tax=Gloeomargarita lithophora Alchichica-D10 TaxID=1188229 RepID=A0A1J0AEJ3_9CYAN|nr:RNA-binding protein [Gloeomargarita lithophora]APB34362.1 RNA-binding region RNP-1 [Gloeomargarita lithophora Alchichica-D10]